MAFDPNSAQPAQGFDPASAQPAGSPPTQGFDPNSAQPEGNFVEKLGNDIAGGFKSASLNGFAGLIARKIPEFTGQGMDQLRQAYPGQTEDWYHARQKDVINQTIQQMRSEAAEQSARGGAIQIGTPLGNFNPVQFAAGMVGGADPTLAIPVPGVGAAVAKLGLKGVAAVGAHIAGNAVTHAGFGSAADAAYQGADMIDGLQKDFDWQRNLEAAAQMGAMGAAGGAYHVAKPVVAPFVKDLFKGRGVDTTPQADPRGITTPLTGQGLNPDELSQYHDVLQNGDHQDIRNFFDGRNITPPSHADIHEWVTRRDAVNEGAAPQDYADPMFHPEPGPPDLRSAVSEHIDNLTQGWKNKPDYEVINHTDDIQDPQVREQAKADGADDPNAMGFYGTDGKVRIFANKLGEDPESMLHAVLYHESLGHYGLAQQFGDKLDRTIKTLDANNVSQFHNDVDDWMKKNPGAYNGDRVRAGEEVLANMSNNGTLKKSLADALTGHVRRFGRAMGMDLKYNDSEVRNILRMAHQAVIKGPDRDVRGNGFRVSTQGFDTQSGDNPNRFMFTGRKATNFNPDHPTAFIAPDKLPRNEISDKDARMLQRVYEGDNHKLSDVLHHPDLYHEYPHLRDLKVAGVYTEGKMNAFYAPRTKTIGLDISSRDPLHSILHEVQHAIQHEEGHSNGATSAANRDEYNRSTGEIEARSTEARQRWTDTQRADSALLGYHPYASQGIHPNDMIVTPAFKTRMDIAAEGKNKFMQRSDYERFRNMDREDQEGWRQMAIRDARSDAKMYRNQLDVFQKFKDERAKNYPANLERQEMSRVLEIEDHPILKEPQGRRFVKSLDREHGGQDVIDYVRQKEAEANRRMKSLMAASATGDLYSKLPDHIQKMIAERDDSGNRFMQRSDYEPASGDRDKDFAALADAQRYHPEHAMVEAQQVLHNYPSGNALGWAMEHVGDLTHRMADRGGKWNDFGKEYVSPKVRKGLEIADNPTDAARIAQIPQLPELTKYAEEHAKLPVYNEAQLAAREAAVALGRRDLPTAVKHLNTLDQMIKDGTYVDKAGEYDSGNRFMRRSDLAPKDVAEEAYDRLNNAYTPSTRSWKETERMAADTAISPEAIKESRGVGNLDRKLFVYDAAAKEANAKLQEIHSRADENGVLTPEDHAAAIETAAHFNYVLGRIENDSRQIARGLNAMKAVRFSRNNLIALKAALEAEGTNMEALADPDTMNKFLKQYFNMQAAGNPAGAAHMMATISKPYWWQYLLTFRQNMMLSGLSTHLKSTMDMATMAGRETIETALAMPGYAVREGLRSMGANVQTGVHPTELAARMWGMSKALLEGKTYVDTGAALAGKSTAAPRYANIADPHIPVVSKITDLVSAQDTFFRSVLNNAHLYSLGARQAYNELKSAGGNVKWDDVMTRGANYARMPSQAMLDAAHNMTEQAILLNRSGLNTAIDKARAIRPNMSGGEQATSFIANLLTPFIRIGANALQNQIIRRSPLAFLDKMTRDDFKAGGARADIATARILLGTSLMVMYWNQSDPKKGKLEGDADANYAKLQEKMAGGMSPNSVHENGAYNKTSNLNLSLNPLDSHNQIATMIAGMRQAYEEGKDTKNLATGVTMAFNQVMHTLANETFINDLAPSIDALTDRRDNMGQKAAKVVGEQAKTFIPNALVQANNAFLDTNKRDVKADNPLDTAANVVKDALPGASQTLPVKQSVYGEPEKTGTDIMGIHNWVTQGNHTNEVTDPAEKELSRLGGLTKAAMVTAVPRTVNVEGAKIKLTPAQAEDYQHYAGQTLVQAVREEQQAGTWNKMSDQDKVNYVRDIQKQAKADVRDALLQKEGWLNAEQLQSLRSQLSATK